MPLTEFEQLMVDLNRPQSLETTYVFDSIRYAELCGIKKAADRQEIKKRLLWGTYGKYAEHSMKLVRLIDCSTEHLHNILRTELHVGPYMREIIIEIIRDRGI